jgi:hypothetical protein
MNWSLGEVRALAVKAGRGAGMPWGLAEEAGFAVHWLEAHGAPGAAALSRHLEGGPILNNACPILRGVEWMDAGIIPTGSVGAVRQPLLLLPFLSSVAKERPHQLIWPGVRVMFASEGIAAAPRLSELLVPKADCEVVPAEPLHGIVSHKTRVDAFEGAAIEILARLSARTYAPATERSRRLGAGSGREDED